MSSKNICHSGTIANEAKFIAGLAENRGLKEWALLNYCPEVIQTWINFLGRKVDLDWYRVKQMFEGNGQLYIAMLQDEWVNVVGKTKEQFCLFDKCVEYSKFKMLICCLIVKCYDAAKFEVEKSIHDVRLKDLGTEVCVNYLKHKKASLLRGHQFWTRRFALVAGSQPAKNLVYAHLYDPNNPNLDIFLPEITADEPDLDPNDDVEVSLEEIPKCLLKVNLAEKRKLSAQKREEYREKLRIQEETLISITSEEIEIVRKEEQDLRHTMMQKMLRDYFSKQIEGEDIPAPSTTVETVLKGFRVDLALPLAKKFKIAADACKHRGVSISDVLSSLRFDILKESLDEIDKNKQLETTDTEMKDNSAKASFDARTDLKDLKESKVATSKDSTCGNILQNLLYIDEVQREGGTSVENPPRSHSKNQYHEKDCLAIDTTSKINLQDSNPLTDLESYTDMAEQCPEKVVKATTLHDGELVTLSDICRINKEMRESLKKKKIIWVSGYCVVLNHIRRRHQFKDFISVDAKDFNQFMKSQNTDKGVFLELSEEPGKDMTVQILLSTFAESFYNRIIFARGKLSEYMEHMSEEMKSGFQKYEFVEYVGEKDQPVSLEDDDSPWTDSDEGMRLGVMPKRFE